MSNTDRAKEQAAAQYSTIADMLAAANCNYSRLDELRDELEYLTAELATVDAEDKAEAEAELATWRADNEAELNELIAEAGNCENEEDARERIQEDPLSVEVRSDWETPGTELTAVEFSILLCTGGPAVRIRGELDEHKQPSRARMEYQDWGTPWTQYFDAEQSTLIEYAQSFYFGE